MPKYVLLLHDAKDAFAKISPEQMQQVVKKYVAWGNRLRKAGVLKGGEKLEFDSFTVGYRPTPTDGYPIVGRVNGHSGLYLAVMHSGMTLAPAIGLLATQEIVDGADAPLLAPYRLARFG